MLPTEHTTDAPARLVIGGEPVDLRTREARRFRALLVDLTEQMGRDPSTSERLQLISAATFAAMCERDSLRMIRGEPFDESAFRRNHASLHAALVSLGMARKSRDVRASDRRNGKSILSQVVDPE